MVFEGSEASEFMEICKIYQKSVWNLNFYKKSAEFPPKMEKMRQEMRPKGAQGAAKGALNAYDTEQRSGNVSNFGARSSPED